MSEETLRALGVDAVLGNLRSLLGKAMREFPGDAGPITSIMSSLKSVSIVTQYELCRRQKRSPALFCPSCERELRWTVEGTTLKWICERKTCPWGGMIHEIPNFHA